MRVGPLVTCGAGSARPHQRYAWVAPKGCVYAEDFRRLAGSAAACADPLCGRLDAQT